MSENAVPQNRSVIRDFLASAATVSGDLSNITAPPSVLSPQSVIEVPSFWAENSEIFVSPANSDDPLQRALLVLRSFLSGMRSQCYLGHSPEEGVKKPLNAFLGELFVGKWEDEHGTTHLLGEQVSHHPPITACRVWNDKYGVIAEGYNRQTVTFNGSVNVECAGHVLKTLTKYDEHYLVPIPGFSVKGVLGTPYPEMSGTYYIPSTSGYTSSIKFSGKGFFSSNKKHSFTAYLYKESHGESHPLITIEGQWDNKFTIHDNAKGEDIEVFDAEANATKNSNPLKVAPIEEQDPWESRNAWNPVITALKKGDIQAISDAKTRLEQGQRDMRAQEQKEGKEWKPLFFRSTNRNEIIEKLNDSIPNEDFKKTRAETEGIWEFNMEAWKSIKKPYHGSLRPDNTTVEGGQMAHEDTKSATQMPNRPKSQSAQHTGKEIDHTIGAVDDGRPAEVNGTSLDVGRAPEAKAIDGITREQPAPQRAQSDVVNEHRGSGVPGMSLEEKEQIENMIRDQYSTSSSKRSQNKRDLRDKHSNS